MVQYTNYEVCGVYDSGTYSILDVRFFNRKSEYIYQMRTRGGRGSSCGWPCTLSIDDDPITTSERISATDAMAIDLEQDPPSCFAAMNADTANGIMMIMRLIDDGSRLVVPGGSRVLRY